MRGLQQSTFWLLVAAMLGVGGPLHAQEGDPNAGSDVIGKIVAPEGPMEFVSIPAGAREAMKANVERLWAITLRTPGLNPPTGFDLKPAFILNGLLPGAREPFIATTTALFYWYRFMPGYGRVRRLDVAMHAFHITTNMQSLVFADRWQDDGDGMMYIEPREIRRVGGYPQYSNGVVVLTNADRPLWTPVARERALRRELAVARESLAGLDGAAAADEASEQLAAWLSERPARQREADMIYEDTKRRNPELAEKIRANAVMAEQVAEKALRQEAERSLQPAVQAPSRGQRQQAEECVSYLEGELTRLAPAELAAPAYISLSARQPVPKPGCSHVVDKTYPDAVGIVAANPDFFDLSLPRTSIQMIVVDFTSFEKPGFSRETWRLKVYESVRDGMDYKALAATLAKTRPAPAP